MLRIMMRTMIVTIVTMTILMTMLTMVHGKRTDIVSSIDKNMTEIVSPIDENELEIVSTMYENEPERVSTMNLTETKKQFSWNDTRIFMGPNNHYLTPENTLDATHISTITAANLIGIPVNSYVMYWIRDRAIPTDSHVCGYHNLSLHPTRKLCVLIFLPPSRGLKRSKTMLSGSRN